jgi:hypothetical protein
MKRAAIVMMAAAMLAAGPFGGEALADHRDDGDRRLKTRLRGIEEPPSVSSTGRGAFRASIPEDRTSIDYKLEYEDLEGDVLQAHIHLGQRGVNGGIAVFLCTNLGNGPAGTQTCPGPRDGSVSGTITGADIIGPAGQGLTTGEFAELLRAIDRSVTYVNVHTSKHTAGEIRGQIDGDDD